METMQGRGSELSRVEAEDCDYQTDYPDLENEEAAWKQAHKATASEKVVKREETDLYSSFGLGLGVDVTDPKPWATKKNAFQARQVIFGDLFGIKGGNLSTFDKEVTSMHEFQSSVKASIPTNNLLNVGIDTEGCRSYRAQKRSVGKEIITRTIFFKSTFKDVPRVEVDSGDQELSFECMLMDFIEERTEVANVESLCLDVLTDYCFRFIEHSSVTHYVHAIVLGASHSRTMTEEEYINKFGANARLGADRIAEIALKNSLKYGKRKSQSVTTIIGRTKKREQNQEEVEEEGLIRVKLKSISSLVVNSGRLRKAMMMALSRYIHKKQDHEFGPFHISCGSIFLKVDRESQNQLTATNDFKDASLFSIIRSDEGEEQFSIVYKPPISPETKMAPPSLFLSTSKHNVPLLMKDRVSKSQLSLCSRYTEHCEGPASIKEWICGGDYYYISCPEVSGLTHRRYLCVTKRQSGSLSDLEYVTACKYRKDHDKPDTKMVFSLIKPSKEKTHSKSGMEEEAYTTLLDGE